MKCAHMESSDEAHKIGQDGREQAIDLVLCNWPDAFPERLVDAPTWLLKRAVGGIAVTPEHDCVGCPAFKPR